MKNRIVVLSGQDISFLLHQAAERLKADTEAVVFSWDHRTYLLMDSNMVVVWGYRSIGDFVQKLREHYHLDNATLMLVKNFGTSLTHPYFLQADGGERSLSLYDAVVFFYGGVDPESLAKYLAE